MPDTKKSVHPMATTLEVIDRVPFVQAGANKTFTLQQFADFVAARRAAQGA
jgi:hypothetical protein